MLLLDDGRVVTSPSDLTRAAACEFAFLRALDAKLGRVAAVVEPEDPMRARAGRLGDRHEAALLERYRATYRRVVEIERPNPRDTAELDRAVAETAAAFADGADVVFQPAFFDDTAGFLGFADFIVRQADGRYQVQDAKLARSAKVTALLQLAAYAAQLERLGIGVSDEVALLLGDGSRSVHRLRDVAPVYRNRSAHLRGLVDERLHDAGPVAWGAVGVTACGRCATCEPEVEASRDLLLVAGLRSTQRARLIEAGIATIDELAGFGGPVEGVTEATLTGLRAQARLQLAAGPDAAPPVELHSPGVIATLPTPDPGDIFFDFEGDPLHSEPGVADETRWGLDYLFGLIEADGAFRAFWAHSMHDERRALTEFLAYLRERRARYPGLHVYHYAAYERTHLLSLAARHGVGEEEVDDLLREGVLVDLYAAVRKALRVGSRSYSLKKIEPLYLDAARAGEVTTAADSVEEYARYRELLADGEDAAAAEVLARIADYNRDDCRSTLGLRNWLVAQAAAYGVRPGTAERPEPEYEDREESPLAVALRDRAGDPLDPDRTADQRALGLASAAVDYFRREGKTFWQQHYARLENPLEEWADTRDVFVIAEAVVEADWHREGRQLSDRRLLRLRGSLAPGSKLGVGGEPFVVYDLGGPEVNRRTAPGTYPAHDRCTVLEADDDGSFLVEERLDRAGAFDRYDALPVALAPESPPKPGEQVPAIAEWGRRLLDDHPAWPRDAVVDVLRRTPPRTRSGSLAPVATDDAGHPTDRGTIDALVASLLDLDSSYVAVQGPPGTGKTYSGAHVITELVRTHGWKVGVVAQSHDTVQNLLAAVLHAGVDAVVVGKAPRGGDKRDFPWTQLSGTSTAAFLSGPGGRVLGGTAWTFAHPGRVARGSLDLLVIDEAGQFSLASTIAASVAARNLLLLGDPQQLPQVSQGTHPEPVDGSALGYVSEGHDVLPAELGYFLPQTRRMDATLAGAVSHLSYDDRMTSHAVTAGRHLAGVVPGLHPVPVASADRATESPEEAARVVELVTGLLGTPWTDPTCERDRDPLEADDVIVVTPYNAQVALIRGELDTAGHPGVRVGTVDRFQGQEAVVAIVSLAASSPADVPRGMSFLILRNRLNVAISRAKWAAYLVHSPELVNYLPTTPGGVKELSAFIELCGG